MAATVTSGSDPDWSARAFDQSGGSHIARLNVRFQPMQLQLRKRVAKHEPDGLRHVTTTRVRGADKVTQIGIPKSAQKDLAKIDRAGNPSIFHTTNEKTSSVSAATTFEKRSELRGLNWRGHQAAM